MNKNQTIAGNAKDTMLDWLLRFSKRHGSPHSAAGVLKTKGLSFQWIQGFASGRIPNPTVGKLRILEERLKELESEPAGDKAA